MGNHEQQIGRPSRHIDAALTLIDGCLADTEAFVYPIVKEIPPKPPKGFSLAHLREIQTLPDNVYLLPRTPAIDPDIA